MKTGDQFAGDQLRLARLAHGFTLEELGLKVGMTRQYLHQLETGVKLGTSANVELLADVLGVTTYFFYQSAKLPVQPEQCHFRKQATTPVSITSQVLARGTLLDQLVERLDSALKLPPVNFPQHAIETAEDIEFAAEECRKHWNLGLSGPITNMMRVVENAGAIVGYFDGISERVDALSMDRRRPLIIRSEAKPAACRLRFDLAHECGHLVMHRGVHTGCRETEGQAHRFAGAFLLPRSAFAREFPRSRNLDWSAIFALKARWKVSARAIIRRAYDLGLITADKYRTGNIHLNKTGQSKVETLDDEIVAEQPELLDTIFRTLERGGSIALREIANGAGISDGMFEVLVGRRLPFAPIAETGNVVRLFSGIN
ncbi:XRE family transcriptional regulator [uncultured Novosphingobium sp.]|uniref:helix-turn-helix domain-containing protein n=1 Tax=uncultured Novosphingobium sp. TaxID=292277 RepID=UPI0025913D71|nr:XRE family transcriptional regulator [uncultured Novosphingobium sp.]